MAFLIRSKKIDLIQLARDLDESPDPSMSKIVLRNLIISSKYYEEEEAKSYWKLLQPKGEEELKDYESLKQVVRSMNPHQKICLENFRKAKRNSDETFSQFASRLTSMWLYYCKLREANDFESVNQLIVADKMFEMLDSETATHIGVLKGRMRLNFVYSGLATGGQVNVVHQQVLCVWQKFLVEDVLLPPDVLDMLGGARSEENSLAQSSQDLRVDSRNVDETEVSSGILPEESTGAH
ncbi:uncharacterized protein TNCV_4799021 [Trichonephila clavipes]|nr:uncharacterized protein TNCV_4799021 [Trichonephila clavipes]